MAREAVKKPFVLSHPELSAKEVVELAAKEGMTLTTASVNNIRSIAKKASGEKPRAKKASAAQRKPALVPGIAAPKKKRGRKPVKSPLSGLSIDLGIGLPPEFTSAFRSAVKAGVKAELQRLLAAAG